MTEEQREVLGSRAWRWALVAIMAATMAVVVFTAFQRVNSEQREQAAVDAASDLAAQVSEVCEEGGEEAYRLGLLCQRAETMQQSPETIVTHGEDGADGEDGEDGRPPTALEIREALRAVFARQPDIPEADIEAAVVRYLQQNPPPSGDDGDDGTDGSDGEDGSDGADGEAGRPPTAEEVAVAVAEYCSGGACIGDDGTDGEDGDRGPGPTDDQIEDAVEQHCSDGKCRGRPGKDGADGEDGEQGPPGGLECEDGYEKVVTQAWVREDRTERPEWTEVTVCRAEGDS